MFVFSLFSVFKHLYFATAHKHSKSNARLKTGIAEKKRFRVEKWEIRDLIRGFLPSPARSRRARRLQNR